MPRSAKRLTACTAVAALVFAHAAIAVQGCLQPDVLEQQGSCEEHQPAASAKLLCRVHYQSETQTLDVSKLPQVPAFDAPVLVLAFERFVPALPDLLLPVRIETASSPPPLSLLYSRLLT